MILEVVSFAGRFMSEKENIVEKRLETKTPKKFGEKVFYNQLLLFLLFQTIHSSDVNIRFNSTTIGERGLHFVLRFKTRTSYQTLSTYTSGRTGETSDVVKDLY